MKYTVACLTLLIALNAVSSVFWNMRPKYSKVRLRPPRHHHEPSVHTAQQAMHRAQYIPAAHYPAPTAANPRPAFSQHVPIRSYRLPSPFPFLRPSTQPMTYATNRPHHVIKHIPMNKIMSGVVKEVEMQTFVENSDAQVSSDGVHGYLSPSYKGWRPIPKPNYLYPVDSDLKQSSTSDYYVYPTTEIYRDVDGKHQQMYFNTLYRHNVNSLKPLKPVKLKPAFSENQNVAIPPPSSFQHFHRNHTHAQQQESESQKGSFSDTLLQASNTEGETVQRKPFPRFQHPKLKRFNTTIGALSVDEEQNQSQAQRTPHPPKFKISRPRLRGHATNNENEPETDGSPQSQRLEPAVPTQFSSESQPSLNLKGKISNSSKVRKRVKVGTRQPQSQPQAYVNADELGNAFNKDGSSERPAGPINSEPGSQELQFRNTTGFNGYSQTTPLYNNFFDEPSRVPPAAFPNSVPSLAQTQANRYQHIKEVHHHTSLPNINPVRDTNSAQPDFNQENPNRPRPRKREREQPKEIVEFNEETTLPYNNNDFYLPADFFKRPSAGGQDPISFMAMDMGYTPEKLNIKPKMIHHTIRQNHLQNVEPRYPIHVPRAPEHQSPRPEPIRYSGVTNFNHNHPPPVHHFVYMNPQLGGHGQRNSFQHISHAATTFPPAPPKYETTIPPLQFQSTAPFPQHFLHTNNPNIINRPSPLPVSTLPTMSYQTYKQSSTTPRSPSHFTTQSNYPPQRFEFKIAKAPNLDTNNLVHPEANSLIPVNHVFTGKEKQFQPYYIEPNSFSVNEYERIPMEFINELRPILMDDELIRTQPPPSTTPFSKPKDVYKPPSFFESFFKPFNSRHRHPTKPPQPHMNSQAADAQGSSSNSLHTYVRTPATKYASLEDPFSSIVSVEQALTEPTIHSIEFVNVENQVPKHWSKLKSGDSEVTFEPSDAKSGEINEKELDAKASEETGATQPSFSKILHQNLLNSSKQADVDSTTSSYANPSPLMELAASSTNSISDDLQEESNTPASVTSTVRPKIRKVIRTRTSSVSEKSTRIVKRPVFKNERLANLDRTRLFSSRVRQRTTEKSESSTTASTTHRPFRRVAPTSATGKPMSDKPFEFDSSRVRPKRRRLTFRKPLRDTTPDSAESEQVNGSSSMPPEDVTYGEGKWYQVPSSTELSQFVSRRIRNQEEGDEALANTFSAAPLTAATPTSSTTSRSEAAVEAEEDSSDASTETLIESQNSSPKYFYDSVGETDNLTSANDGKETKSKSSTD